MEKFTILEIMRIIGISKRTLHYYDSIGLLKPSKKKENGYRVYSKKDLIRLQQILLFKETGLELKEIANLYSYMKNIMNCSLEVFGYICQGYVADPRFRSYFKKFGQEKIPELILEASEIFIDNYK